MSPWVGRAGSYVVAIAGAFALFGIGYQVGEDHGDALIDFLRERNHVLDSDAQRLSAELTSIKLEVAQHGAPHEGPAGAPTVVEARSDPAPVVVPPDSEMSKSATISMTPEGTEELFGGRLQLTLVAVDFGGDPLRHRAYFTVGALGKPAKPFEAVDPGFATQYEGFDVRVVSTGFNSASFRAERLE